MQRINLTGCGYSIQGGTYTCKPIPKLASVVGSATFVPSVVPLDAIPQHLEGFVMTLAPILDMEPATGLEIPELECRVELDPFKTTADYAIKNLRSEYTKNDATLHDGFLDFYYFGNGYSDSVYIRIDGGDQIKVKSEISPYIIGGTCSFNSEQVVGPGILEPMLDTEFSPITVDTIPPSDAHFDTTTYLFDIFDAWRELVDMRLNNLHDFVVPFDYSDITGLLDLEVAKNLEGSCANFQIKMLETSGIPLAPTAAYTQSASLVPTYQITAGTVNVNGTQVPVTQHVTSVYEPPFHAYLDITSGEDGYAGVVSAVAGPYSPSSGHTAIYIGGVTAVNNAFAAGTLKDRVSEFLGLGKEFTEYEIIQGDCIADVDLLTGSESGYVYMTVAQGGGRQYTTDQLLNTAEFEYLTPANWSRGVQAAAISAYVAAHGGGGTGDGMLYPDYAELSSSPENDTPVAGPGTGITMVFPVSTGQSVGYMTAAETTGRIFAKFVPGTGQVGSTFQLAEGSAAMATQVTQCPGYVRFSILDDGTQAGHCVHFAVDTTSWSGSLPIYRFGEFGESSISEVGYTGPFAVTVDDGTYHVTCPTCGTVGVIGWYSVNGQYETAVTGDFFGPVGTASAVYFHKTASTMSIDTEPGNTLDATDYTIRLANVTGNTAYQMHYGNIFIDGRWSSPEPPPPYTVTDTDGTAEGSLFDALSAPSDTEILVSPDTNGRPIDFNGASVL